MNTASLTSAAEAAEAAEALSSAGPAAGAAASLADRVRELERTYRDIETTRMAGLGITHPKLRVAAVGFEPVAAGGALGVLVTPWFMNLVWLPDPVSVPEAAADAGASERAARAPALPVLAVGHSRARPVGCELIDFLGAHEAGIGSFETCSLFSPMFDFVDQEAAEATAKEVLALLRKPPETAADAPPPAPAAPAAESEASRRAFLLGRRTA